MSEQPQPRDPLGAFTFVGRVLVLATLLVAGGLFYWHIMFFRDHLPAHSYPVAFLLIPVVIGSAIFFGVVALILRIFGIRVWRDPDDKSDA